MTIWQVLGIAGFLILCGIWLILYAACVVSGQVGRQGRHSMTDNVISTDLRHGCLFAVTVWGIVVVVTLACVLLRGCA